MVLYRCCSDPLGLWSDGIASGKDLLLRILLALASSLLMGLWPSVGIMLLGRALSGAAAATWVTFTVLFSSRFSSEDAPKAMGLAVFYSNLGQILATLIGGHIAELYGWHAPFVLGAVCALAGVLLSLGIRETRQVKRESPVVPAAGVGGRSTIVSGLAILVQYMTFATMYGFTPICEGIGADAAQLSLLTFWSTLPMAAAAPASSSGLASRLGTSDCNGGFVLGPWQPQWFPCKPCLSCISPRRLGAWDGCRLPLVMGMSIQTVREKRATAMGFFQAIYSLGMFGGPIIVGIIGDISGLAGGFLSTGAVGLLGSLLAWRLLPAPGIQDRQAPHQMGAAGKQ